MSDCLYDAYDDSEDYYDTQYEDLQELDLTGYEDEQLEWSDLYQSCVLPSFLQISAYILPCQRVAAAGAAGFPRRIIEILVEC
ncbi:hypothetical protein pipiens_014419 [Culex pipiens pipiens]|uniref:Uncharacterized protein n=1 Tax=Culex pipiens pipiens TaxID=38569 RepID=A0ABD1CV82_CULPP